MLPVINFIGIQLHKNEEQNGKAPEPRASITKKWKRDTNRWDEPHDHTRVDHKMDKQNGGHTITIDPTEL